MRIEFKTNLDCCRPYMCNLNEGFHVLFDEFQPIPLVGDKICVLETPTKVVEMEVQERTWSRPIEYVTGNKYIQLNIYLGLTPFWDGRLLEFEKWVKK